MSNGFGRHAGKLPRTAKEGAMNMKDWDTGKDDGAAVLYQAEHNASICRGCGLCAAFCPMDVYEMRPVPPESGGASRPAEMPVVVST